MNHKPEQGQQGTPHKHGQGTGQLCKK